MSASAFSYASFSRGAGGWQVGETVGELSQEHLRSLISAVPTQLSDGTPIPTYPDKAERARLVHRYAWLPAPWNPAQRVFYASVPAGSDATGRPGNVFTYASVAATGTPVAATVQALHSPDIPTPFGPRETETVQIPPQLKTPGPIRDLLPIFLDGWEEESPLPEPFNGIGQPKGTHRHELARFLAGTLAAGQPVILAAPPAEAALWVAAVVEEAPSLDFGFSTFERFNSAAEILGLGAQLLIVPPQDVDRVRATAGTVTVIATTDPVPGAPAAPAVAVPAPVSVDLGGALDNPFGEVPAAPAHVPAPDPLRADHAEQLSAVSDYLQKQNDSSHLTVGLTISPNHGQIGFLHHAKVPDWVRSLRNEVDEPLTVSHILGFLLFPPTTYIGRRTRAMVLAAEVDSPGSSSAVSSFGWLFDVPADLEEEILNEAVRELAGIRRLSDNRRGDLPIADLVTAIVEKHHQQQRQSIPTGGSWLDTHKPKMRK